MNVRRAALLLLIVSIVVSGILAIVVLLLPEMGRLPAKVLISALATSGASICGMACGAAWDQRRWRGAALAGLVVAATTLVFTKLAIWIEPEPINTIMKGVATCWIASIAAAHISLLSLARTDALLEKVRAATVVAALLLAIGLALPIWYEDLGDNERYFRGVGVVAVLVLMGSLGLPVAGRLRELPVEDSGAEESDDANVMCPACGHVQSVPLGVIECAACTARFRVELERS